MTDRLPSYDATEYRIVHGTRYLYSDPVAICQNQLRMQPSTRNGVEVHSCQLKITPTTDSEFEHQDYFNNSVRSFTIEAPHQELEVVATSDLTVYPRDITAVRCESEDPDISWNDISGALQSRGGELWKFREFCFQSPRISTSQTFADFTRDSFTTGRPIVDAVFDLTCKINREFRYDTNATHVNTTTEEAFRLKAGVCQDFAHVQIACLRSLGLPARYVSGYLRTVPPDGEQKLVGADESHAWVSVWAGQELGWIDCDPTNACFASSDHIPICIGRDYSDVAPMRGVVLGGGQTTLEVNVDVRVITS